MDYIFRELNPHACRSYMLGLKSSGSVVMIDPVLEHVREYISILEKERLELSHVIDTHTHADHISGGAALKDLTGCNYLMHTNAPSECVDIRVNDNETVRLSGLQFTFLHTPGHTMDSMCIVCRKMLFSGDTLFLDDGGAGRDDLPGGNPSLHWESLQRLKTLDDNLIVYPAHDYRGRKPSALGRQKKENPHMGDFDREEFVEYIDSLALKPVDWMKDVINANYSCALDPTSVWIPTDLPACEVAGTMGVSVNEIHVDHIEKKELMNLLKSEYKPVLIDVREANELLGIEGYIDGIVHIPLQELSSNLNTLEIYRNRPIVTVCHMGARAAVAAKILKKAGFPDVSVLKGGMKEWRSETDW